MEAGEDVSQAADGVLVVSRDRLDARQTGIAVLYRAIGVQLHQTDREQLHDLAGVVLVRSYVVERIGLLVAEHRQVAPHHRAQGDRFQQIPVIAERVLAKHVVVACQRHGFAAESSALIRHHKDLTESKCGALTQLVRRIQGALEKRLVAGVVADIVATCIAGHFRQGGDRLEVAAVAAEGEIELGVHPGGFAVQIDRIDFRHLRTKGALGQQARCVGTAWTLEIGSHDGLTVCRHGEASDQYSQTQAAGVNAHFRLRR